MQEGTCVEFEYEAYAMPTYEGAEVPVSGSFGSYGFIAFDSGDEAKNDAIRKAIEVYLVNPECQTIVSNATGRLSVMTDTVVEYATEAIADTMAVGSAYSASYTDSSFGVLESWWTEFRGTFYPNLQDFYTGNIDAGTLLDRWQEAGDAVIAAAQ
jgi:ABC-type glycerol-3-phosphate transport system substrate-binding protein